MQIRKTLSKLKRRISLVNEKPQAIFSDIFEHNFWGDSETVSGDGSRLDRTDKVRAALPVLIHDLGIRTFLDIPCGDYNWMKLVEMEIDYIGADIVEPVILQNRSQYTGKNRKFVVLDLLADQLPEVDLIFCRDCLVHFSNKDIFTALKNFKLSGSRYLLTTTFTKRVENQRIVTGEWHPVNLSIAPFFLPEPSLLVDDSYDSPNYFDKQLGLWKIADIPIH